MAVGRYRLTIQTGYTSLIAIVGVEVEPADETSCLVSALHGEWVPSDWAQAATRGVEAAVFVLGRPLAVCVREVVGTGCDTTLGGIAAATMSAVLAAAGCTPRDRKAIFSWHQQHAFRMNDLPTLAQLRELVDP